MYTYISSINPTSADILEIFKKVAFKIATILIDEPKRSRPSLNRYQQRQHQLHLEQHLRIHRILFSFLELNIIKNQFSSVRSRFETGYICLRPRLGLVNDRKHNLENGLGMTETVQGPYIYTNNNICPQLVEYFKKKNITFFSLYLNS